MHTRNGILLATLGIIALALAPGLVLAKGKHAAAAPSATVRLEAKQVAAGVGWARGDGVHNYGGGPATGRPPSVFRCVEPSTAAARRRAGGSPCPGGRSRLRTWPSSNGLWRSSSER